MSKTQLRCLFGGCLFGSAVLMAASVAFAQSTVTNDDLVKLAKSGLSDDFIVNSINQSSGGITTDTFSLVDMKKAGVSERVLAAAITKSPMPQLSATDIQKLQGAQFSDQFLLDLIRQQPQGFRLTTNEVIALKESGVSERVLTAMNASAEPTRPTGQIPVGTQVVARLIDSVDSNKAAPGDHFRASLAEPLVVDGKELAPRGADASVVLSEEKDAGRLTGKTVVSLSLDSVMINGTPVRIQTAAVEREGSSQTRKTATRAGVVGALGALIGGIAGGGTGAAIGAGAGAAAGAGSVLVTKGAEVKLPSETVLTFALSAPASF